MQNLRTTGPGVAKPMQRWPNLVELFKSPLFERYAMGWARRYLPLDQGPFLKAEQELQTLIRSFRSEAMWPEASGAIVRHLHLTVRKAVAEHLMPDMREQAEQDLAKEDFSHILPAG